MADSRLVNRNVIVAPGRTSMRLEPELWDAPLRIRLREDIDTSELVRQIESRGHCGGRTSAVRVYMLQYYRMAATEQARMSAGHGLNTRRAA